MYFNKTHALLLETVTRVAMVVWECKGLVDDEEYGDMNEE